MEEGEGEGRGMEEEDVGERKGGESVISIGKTIYPY